MPAQTQFVHDQHLVPRWHLRNFVDADGKLWCFRRHMPVKKFAPKGTCWERDFYEFELNGKRTDNKYENWLGRIENDAATRMQLLLDRGPFGQHDATIWATYVASLFVRTEKYRAQMSAAMVEKFGQQSQSPGFVRDMQYELLKEGRLVFADDLKKQVEQLRRNMDNSPSFYHLSGLERNVISLGDAIMRKNWHTVEAPAGKFFVTSDCPVTTVELVDGEVKPGAGLGKENTAVILTVTPKHLFVAASPRIYWKSVGEPKLVDSVNLLTVCFAHKRVYSHLNLPETKGLVDAYINYFEFGKNVFLPASQNQN
jgi:hypothetical protein